MTTHNTKEGFEKITLIGTTNFAGIYEGVAHDSLMPLNRNPSSMLRRVKTMLGNDVVFIIERNFNRNVVVYKMRRTANGLIKSDNPIDVFWLIIPDDSDNQKNNSTSNSDSDSEFASHSTEEEDGNDAINNEYGHASYHHSVRTEELTKIEQNLAYGATCASAKGRNGEFVASIRALHGEPLYLHQDATQQWVASIIWTNPTTSPSVAQMLTLERITACTVSRPWGLWPTVVQLHVQTKAAQNRELILHYKI